MGPSQAGRQDDSIRRSRLRQSCNGLNNRAENPHQPTRRRERQTKRSRSAGRAQRLLSANDGISNLVLLQRHQVSAPQYQAARLQACQVRAEVAGVAAAT